MLTLVPLLADALPLVADVPELDDEVDCCVTACPSPATWLVLVDCQVSHGTWSAPVCHPCFHRVQVDSYFFTCGDCTSEGGRTRLVLERWTAL